MASFLNCSAHTMDYKAFENVTHVFLPPTTTSGLQPVGCAVGRYFKCAYRRLLVFHSLQKVNEAMDVDASEFAPFKMNHVVTYYD